MARFLILVFYAYAADTKFDNISNQKQGVKNPEFREPFFYTSVFALVSCFILISCGFAGLPQSARSIGYGSLIECPDTAKWKTSFGNQAVLQNKIRH